jgi:hypothetical protein
MFLGALLILTSLFTTEVIAQQPAKPGTLNVTATVGDRKITATWDALPAGTFTHYQAYIGGNWEDLSNNPTTVTQDGLTNETHYAYRFRARNGATPGDESLVSGTPRVPAPTGLTATAGDGQVSLGWTKPSGLNPPTGVDDVTRYEYTKDGGTNWVSTEDATLSHTVTGLTNGTEYTFKVRAVRVQTAPGVIYNEKGLSSATATATPTISAPTVLTATAGEGEVSLSWTAVSGVSTITKYQYQQGSGTWTDTSSTTSHTVTGLTGGVLYSFKVRAYGTGGGGTASNSASATPQSSPTPPQPPVPSGNSDPPAKVGPPENFQVVTVEDTATKTANAILTWDPPSNMVKKEDDPIRYAYRYRASPYGPWTLIPTGSSSTTYTVTGLQSGREYEFQIAAFYDSAGITSLSSNNSSTAAVSSVSKPKQRIIQECPVGWVRSDGFAGRTRRALIYEVKLEMEVHNPISIYKPDWVAIYVHPDEALENLDGWKLQVAIPYNHHREYLLTAENSVVVDAGFVEGGFAFIENP